MERNVYVSMSAMFSDTSGLFSRKLCRKLNKSLYGLCEAPKLWHAFLEQGLEKTGFKTSWSDPGIYYGRDMALAVYIDNVLFFGPDTKIMKKVISELKLQGFELKIGKN